MINYDENRDKAREIIKKFEMMKGDRVNWDSHWEDLAEYFLPKKDNIYGYRLEGEKKHNKLYDSTSLLAMELLASSLHGMLTNPSSNWFGLSTGVGSLDSNKPVRQYLQDCTQIIIDTLNQTNFQEEIHETYLDLCAIGTTILTIEEDEEKDVTFRSAPIYSSYIAESANSIVDKLGRCYEMTWRQIKQKFPKALEMLEDCLYEIEDKPEMKQEVIYFIEPDGKKWKAYHVLRNKEVILKESKYSTFPFAVPRWTKLNEEVYGRSPAMKALPDAKMVNAIMRTVIRGMQKVVDPPMMVPDNGFLLPLNTTPGGTNYYRAGMRDRIELFPVGSRPDVGLDFIDNIRDRIRQHFFIDQIQLINQRDMTATEVMQRNDERLRFLGPILGRMNNELLRPIIDRVFDILERRGKFPKPPIELRNAKEIKIIYTSQIARAQRTAESDSLMRVIQAAAPLLQANPQAMDNFNTDEAVRHFSNMFGLPEKMLNSAEDVQANRQAQAAQQQAMMQAQMGNTEADTQMKQAKARQQ